MLWMPPAALERLLPWVIVTCSRVSPAVLDSTVPEPEPSITAGEPAGAWAPEMVVRRVILGLS